MKLRIPSIWFQSAPRLSEGGNSDGWQCDRVESVSIRPPPFGRGKLATVERPVTRLVFQSAPRLSEGGNDQDTVPPRGPTGFQSAPRLSEGGNHRWSSWWKITVCFNPPPAFRKGETTGLTCNVHPVNVSIRPPPFGRGKPLIGEAAVPDVQFQSAPRLSEGGNAEPVAMAVHQVEFQSAPRLSEGGNA